MDSTERSRKYQANEESYIVEADNSHSIIFNYCEPNSIVLDVGCACGELGLALSKAKKCTCYGVEYDAGSVKIAKSTGAYKDVRQMDLDSLNELPFDEKFDYIVCGDVLEHLKQPYEVLKKLGKYLSKNGCFIISLPNVCHGEVKSNLLLDNFNYTPTGILDNTHLRFFTYKSIASNLAEIGYAIENCKYTYCARAGDSPDVFNELPISVQYYILKDWYSYILQFVMLVIPAKGNFDEVSKKNLEKVKFDKTKASKYITKYRKQQLFDIFSPITKQRNGSQRTLIFFHHFKFSYTKRKKKD